jgi:hypothetical protein
MSARTEKLVEEIRNTERALVECEREGNAAGAAHLKTVLRELQRQLNTSNEALTEGKQILKG